ncbi:MAG: glycine oxidase ThiO [Pirellulales bacterium]|nr:glycine oxidase ThiO [Pirellulales bacterium]
MDDCLIVGGGVVGLSLAYELAGHGQRVRVLERGQPGQEASWAGAGILPPGHFRTATDPYEALSGLSFELHGQWAEQLRAQTGVDTGYRRSGAIYVARTPEEVDLLRGAAAHWRAREVACEDVSPARLAELEPALAVGTILAALYVPDECQLRNPWHLRALVLGCQRRGVTIETGVGVDAFELSGGRAKRVVTPLGPRPAESFCLCGGAWTHSLLARLGVEVAMRPVRGQIALLRTSPPTLSRIVNEGRRYLVPRADGRVLVGSTEEEVGFDKRTTSAGIAGLLEFAIGLAPALAHAELERGWAGLRPGTVDGLPYLGRVPTIDNAFVAAGHARAGLGLSPGTAVVMSQLIRGEPLAVPLDLFRIPRS